MSHEDALKKGTKLNNYGKGIKISDSDWKRVEENGGERMTPSVKNNSDEDIYFKPEKTIGNYKNDGAYRLEAGKDLYMPIDGIATGYYKNKVVKAATGTTITVGRGGTVSFSGVKKAFRIMPIYGWIFRDAIPSGDSSWNNLFDKACLTGGMCGGRGTLGSIFAPTAIKACYKLKEAAGFQ